MGDKDRDWAPASREASETAPEPTRSVAVVGGGPAGLMAAEVLAEGGASVTVYDRMPSLGRKLLMAGLSGLNLTNTEPLAPFVARYGDADPRLAAAVAAFPPDALRAWCQGLGQDTFAGSSGRVFPQAMKASPLLRAWLARLDRRGVRVALRHRWTGWDAAGRLTFATPDGAAAAAAADATVLALGGASWPRLGSDGLWAAALTQNGDAVTPFAPSNCGFAVPWSPVFLARHEGAPLKNVALRFGPHRARGDLVVTRQGLEGGPLYALARPLREALAAGGPVDLVVALRPDIAVDRLAERLGQRKPRESLATALKRTLALAPAAIGLLQEAAHRTGTPLEGLDAGALARRVNAVPVRLSATAGLDRAISTAGGLAFAALEDRLMLESRPGTFAAGEMLDWEAPTGGYLLQACFASGRAAGAQALAWLSRSSVAPRLPATPG